MPFIDSKITFKLTEYGTHQELLDKNGFYAHIYEKQQLEQELAALQRLNFPASLTDSRYSLSDIPERAALSLSRRYVVCFVVSSAVYSE